MKGKNSIVLLVVVLLVAALAAGCASQQDQAAGEVQASVLNEIQERGKMRVGAECLYKGTCYVDPDTGERSGYSVDLANLMAQDLGVEIEWVDVEWGALIPAIETGKADIIMMGMTNTPERAKVVEMSRPMDYYPGVLVMPADSPLQDLDSLDAILAELNKPERVVTFLLGGAQERTIDLMLPDAEKRGLDMAAAYMEVASGRADAMFVDAGDAADMVQENSGGKVWNDEIIYTEHGSMVLRAGDQRFLNWVNNWIDYYQARGTLRSLKVKWYEIRDTPEWMRAPPPGGGVD